MCLLDPGCPGGGPWATAVTFRAMLSVAAPVDCEALHSGWPQQPINTWSALAFILVGVALVLGSREYRGNLVGTATMLIGAGSILFHGGDSGFGSWLHDWSIGALLIILIGFAAGDRTWIGLLISSLAVFGAVTAIAPEVGEAWLVILVVVFIVREAPELRRRARPAITMALAVAGVGAVATIAGRSGGPWCSPSSLLQLHAVWHVTAAVAILFYSGARGWLGHWVAGPSRSDRPGAV